MEEEVVKSSSNLQMNNNNVHLRRSQRTKRLKNAKKAHGMESTQQESSQKYNLWSLDDNGYTLLRKGSVLTSSPKMMHELGSLKEEFLWHFKSTSKNINRIQALDKCSLYEAVFKVEGVEEGCYVYPTHDQLAQIYKGFNMSKANSIQKDGVPYVTDKRLRRYMREKKTRSSNTKKTREKKKRRRRQEQSNKMSMEKDKYEGAPVRIDWKIAFATPKSTIRSMKNAGIWAISFNPVNLPKRAKLQTLVKKIDTVLDSIGPADALTDKERAEYVTNLAKILENSEEDALEITGTDENSINDTPIIYDELDTSTDKLSSCYFPGTTDTLCEDDDSGLDNIYEDLAANSTALDKRSTTQKRALDMGSYVSDPFRDTSTPKTKTKKKNPPSPSRRKRKRQPQSNEGDNDNNEDDDTDKLFESEKDQNTSPQKKHHEKKEIVENSVDGKIRIALKNKGSVPGIPELWYQMHDQLGFNLAMETIKKTNEYSLISAFLK